MSHKVSVDLETKQGEAGEISTPILQPTTERVRSAFEVALMVLDWLRGDSRYMVEVIKISWYQRGGFVSKFLVLCFEVILTEPRISGEMEPAKFKAYLEVELTDVFDREKIAVLLARRIRKNIVEQAKLHSSMEGSLQAKAKYIGV